MIYVKLYVNLVCRFYFILFTLFSSAHAQFYTDLTGVLQDNVDAQFYAIFNYRIFECKTVYMYDFTPT